jgi:magnesium transporter
VAADKAAARNSSGRYFRYNSDAYSEQSMEKAVLPEGFGGEGEVSWLDVTGINDSQLLRTIGNALSIHPLILEDIQNTDHRPKIETFPGYVLIIFKMLQWEPDSASVSSEQVSLILGKNFVLTFQERPGDVFEPVRDRIRRAKGRVRTAAADYLAYALLDVVTDRYFRLIEEFEDKMETIEDAIEDNIKSFDYSEIRELRRELIQVRRAVWPLRELIAAVSDSYHTNLNTSMNAVMKVLTVIATIFIPLTFLAGVYGMNFRFMPELQWRWGYFAVLGIMGLIGVAMFLYFKKKKWL